MSRLEPENGARFAKLAALCLRDKDWDAAEAAAILAVSADRDCAEGWLALGVTRARRSEHQAALIAYMEALRLRPDDVSCWTDVGELYISLLRYPEAAAALRQAMVLDPEAMHPAGRRARAVAAQTMGELKRRTG